MEKDNLKITKNTKTDTNDGYKVFSVRLSEITVDRLNNLSKQTNRSRNQLINMILEYGLDRIELID